MDPESILIRIGSEWIDVLHPNPARISIPDMAHRLALQCRFSGACSRHYSIAEHSINVAKFVPRRIAIHGLLHDAHEAYLGDVIRPLKVFGPAWYLRAAAALDEAVRQKLSIPALDLEGSKHIKQADDAMLWFEWIALMPPPVPSDIVRPSSLRSVFISRHEVLMREVEDQFITLVNKLVP